MARGEKNVRSWQGPRGLALGLLLRLATGVAMAGAAMAGATMAGAAVAGGSAAVAPTVEGTVWAGGGSPAVGARVDLVSLAPRARAGRLILSGRTVDEPVASARVDAAGRYRLTAPPGVYRLRIESPGRLASENVPLVLHETREMAPLVLPRAADGVVRAADAAGRPLHHGLIWAVGTLGEEDRGDGWRPQARLLRLGDAESRHLPRAGNEKLDLSLIGPRGRIETRRGILERAVDLRLPAASAYVRQPIRVVDADDRPLAGALIEDGELLWPLGLTNAEGELEVRVRRDRETLLIVVSPDGRTREVRRTRDEETARFQDVAPPLIIDFAAPVIVEGQVRETNGGQPIAGALVWPGGDPGTFVLTGEDGRFQLVAPRHGAFRLQAEAPGRRPRGQRIEPGQAAVFELPPAATVAGRVVDPDGRPIAGVHLAALPRAGRDRRTLRFDTAEARAHSDADGRFRLAGLEPEADYVVLAGRPGYGAVRRPLRTPTDFRDGWTVVLPLERRVHGRVADAAGQPLADAAVVITASEMAPATRAPREDAASRFVARTDADGRFADLAVPDEEIDLTAFKEGFAPTTVRGLRIAPQPDTDLGTVVLLPGTRWHGRAVDPDGEPVEGVEIHAFAARERIDRLMGSTAKEIRQRPPDAHSDAAGRFAISGRAPGERLHLLLRRDGYRATWQRHVEMPLASATADEWTVVLDRAAVVRGRVVDEAGEPIAGAFLHLSWRDPAAEDLAASTPWSEEREARSDEDGRFAFGDARPGEVRLTADAPGFVPAPARLLTVDAAAGGEEAEDVAPVTVVLEHGGMLEGTITTASGEPLPGARVRCGAASEGAASEGAEGVSCRGRVLTDDAGLYRMSGVPLGAVEVEAHHYVYGRLVERLEIEPGQNVHDFVFEEGFALRGRVVDGNGLGLEGVTIEMHSTGVELRFQGASTDADGGFEWPAVAAGDYRLRLHKPGFAPQRPETLLRIAADVEDLELVMQTAAVLRGAILGLDFDQLAAVQVVAEAVHDQGSERPGSRPGRVRFDGQYEVRDLAPGEWRVRAVLDGGRRQTQARARLEPGVATAELDLEFTSGLRLHGRVLQDGEPVAGARLALAGHDLAVRRTVQSDHQGAFQIDDLEPGRYRLQLTEARRQLVHNRDLELFADRELVVDLRPARLGGRAVGTDGPLGGALIVLRRLADASGEENMLTAGTDDEGTFYFPRVPPGRYRASLRAAGWAAEEIDLELIAGERRDDFELEARPTAGLHLDVSTATGPRPDHLVIAVLDASGSAWLREIRPLDTEGRAVVPSVPPGRHDVFLTAPGMVPLQVRAKVPGDPLSIVLEPAVRLRVHVPELAQSDRIATLRLYDSAGRPWRDLDAYAMPRQSWPLIGGRSRLEHLPAGPWTLVAESPDGRVWSGSVNVVAGVDVEVRLE